MEINSAAPSCKGTSSSGFDIKRFTRRLISGPWFMMVASFLIMSMAGVPYMFSLYSGSFKSVLGYDQTTLNYISFFKGVGANVGIVAGLIFELAPPWSILAIGLVLNFCGHLMMWLSVSQIISTTPWLMCLYVCVGVSGTSFVNTGVMVTAVKNFPRRRGVVIGLVNGYMGLSGAIVVQLYHAIFGNDAKSLILLLSLLPTAMSVVFLPAVRRMEVEHQPNELRVFYKFLFMSLGIAGFLFVAIVLQWNFTFTRHVVIGTAAITMFLLFLNLSLAIVEEYKLWKNGTTPSAAPRVKIKHVNNASPLALPLSVINAVKISPELQKVSWWGKLFSRPKRGDDWTIVQALFSIDMMLLLLAAAGGAAGMVTAIDSLGEIGRSLGYPEKRISTFVSLVSIWNYVGRVAAGFVSDHFLIKYRFPRPLMLAVVLILCCVGHLLVAFNPPGGLFVASALIGFCYGAQWPLLFSMVSEIFGLGNFATLYNLVSAATPAGVFALNVKVAGHFYDKEAKMLQVAALGPIGNKGEGQSLRCRGVACFQFAFIIIGAVTLFAALVSLVLLMRTRMFYITDVYNKLKDEDDK